MKTKYRIIKDGTGMYLVQKRQVSISPASFPNHPTLNGKWVTMSEPYLRLEQAEQFVIGAQRGETFEVVKVYE